MTRGAFEKRWTVYGGWLHVLPDNGAWPRPCAELLTALATSENMRKEEAFRIAILCAVELRDQLAMMTMKLKSTITESGKCGD
jgi:hypothetical protein